MQSFARTFVSGGAMIQDNVLKDKFGLNEQQLQMLNLFKKPMSEADYDEIRRAIVKVLARNIDAEMERLEEENGWTAETYAQWGEEHNRIPYKR